MDALDPLVTLCLSDLVKIFGKWIMLQAYLFCASTPSAHRSNNNHITTSDSDNVPSPPIIKSEPSSPLHERFGRLPSSDDHQIGGATPQHNSNECNGELSDGGSADTEDLLTMSSSQQQQGEGEHPSPTSKLQRLLTESRQMVQNLEQTALPPYVQQSPNNSTQVG